MNVVTEARRETEEELINQWVTNSMKQIRWSVFMNKVEVWKTNMPLFELDGKYNYKANLAAKEALSDKVHEFANELHQIADDIYHRTHSMNEHEYHVYMLGRISAERDELGE